MARGTTCFWETVIGRDNRFSGQTSPVIELSIKSKKDSIVNFSSKTTSFVDKDGEKFLHELPFSFFIVFGYDGSILFLGQFLC